MFEGFDHGGYDVAVESLFFGGVEEGLHFLLFDFVNVFKTVGVVFDGGQERFGIEEMPVVVVFVDEFKEGGEIEVSAPLPDELVFFAGSSFFAQVVELPEKGFGLFEF